jgi:hypothetical protein
MKNKFIIPVLSFVIASLFGCSTTSPEPCPVVKEQVVLNINQNYQSEKLEFYKTYTSLQNNNIWFTKSKFYLSNVVAVKDNGDKNLISPIVLLDYSLDSTALQVSGSIAQGNYVAIEFDLGVREDLNTQDPATYPMDHPLSVANNMYWGWSTQYIFSKLEGFEVAGLDTASFVIHTGTQDLYRPAVNVPVSFIITSGGNETSITLDLYRLLYQSGYTFDLHGDGQSHTVDNLPLAIHYMDNFTHGFY